MCVQGQALQHEYTTMPGSAGPFLPSPKKNQLRQFLVYMPPALMIGPFHAANIMFLQTSVFKINNICGIKQPNHRGRWHVHQKLSSQFFFGGGRNGLVPQGTVVYSWCSACPQTHVPSYCSGQLCCMFFHSYESVCSNPTQISCSKHCT